MPHTYEWLVGIALAYLVVGVEKLIMDFTGGSLDRPTYTYEAKAPFLLLMCLTWPWPASRNRQLVYLLCMWVSASVLFAIAFHWGAPIIGNLWIIAAALFLVRLIPIVRYVVMLPVVILTEILFLVFGSVLRSRHPGQQKRF